MKFQSPKGTRDFYPEDMAIRNWIMDAWRRVSLRHGLQEYDGPIFEYLDLYRAKSGEGIVSELFHFEDRGGRELAIRPEMTPTLARMINAKAQALPRPIKWFSMPRLCRAERPQRGRLREFFQWNVDIVGDDSVTCDAECILVAADFFREIGLQPIDVVIRINSRSLLAALLAAQGVSPDRYASIYAVLDKRDKLPADVFAEELAKITTSQAETDALVAIGAAKGADGLATLSNSAAGDDIVLSELERLKRVFDLLGRMGVGQYCEFDMGVVRGLAYYTGVVFEGFSRGSMQRAVCGGGRYGELLAMLGGPVMSGLGFGTSDVVIEELLKDAGRLPTDLPAGRPADFFVIDADAALFEEVLALVAQLRQAGYRADFSYKRQNVGKQLKQAGSAARAVIVGQEFVERRALAVKDLNTARQVEIDVARFLADPMGKLE